MKGITTIILAGGESKRMGKDKAFLTLNGKTFLRLILETVDTFSNQIIISGNKDKNVYLKETYKLKNKPVVVKDIDPFKGPLNGIRSCSDFIEEEIVFIATCDTPIIKKEAIFFLYKNLKNHQCVIPVINGKFQPMNTFYRKEAVEKSKEMYDKGIDSMFKWITFLDSVYVDETLLKEYDRDLITFRSINTPEEYQKLLEKFEV